MVGQPQLPINNSATLSTKKLSENINSEFGVRVKMKFDNGVRVGVRKFGVTFRIFVRVGNYARGGV